MDFHSHLMEFDIPDTLNWHTISMTTHDFDAKPGDRVYGQLALMDWGLEKYRVDLDYFKVDIVNVNSGGPDKGVQVPYHPPVPDVNTFYLKDFGMVRVVEILGGDRDWDQKSVTYNKLCQGQTLNQVFNSQMIIDIAVAPGRGNKNRMTISNPVLQRMIDGKTLGLAIRPLGAVNASFYAKENQVENLSPKLHFNVD